MADERDWALVLLALLYARERARVAMLAAALDGTGGGWTGSQQEEAWALDRQIRALQAQHPARTEVGR